ncbi:metallophosphoesterase [Acidicapsa acidisoli]|uniref:metallophosphoesterase n=1 Tax=Acidicapsa acidisoli TaxID=1615681 RepID=UPI0021DFDCC2|nr:metallophosphoesterase [Acidicapsa acidisoli]
MTRTAQTSGSKTQTHSIFPTRLHSVPGARTRCSLYASITAMLFLFTIAGNAHAQETSPANATSTDATFTFTADVHVSFDGYDDHQGILDDVQNQHGNPLDIFLIGNETMKSSGSPASHQDACVGSGFSMEKDLCNQIQLVRKLNRLPTNEWSAASFQQNNHTTYLSSAGKTIGTPLGLIIAGDLTDCGGGSDNVIVHDGTWHSENCDIDYTNGIPGKELEIFQQLFDRDIIKKYNPLALYPVIQGLENPDEDAPLKYWIYPGLGNHDLGYDKSGDMMNYVRQWNSGQPTSDWHHVLNSDPISGSYSWDWGRLHVVNVGVFAGSSNTSKATDANYAYDQGAMDWLSKDLATYASDGRPVILAQHFGFDPYSWSSSWYLDSAALQGAQNIWAVLANYNVIGIFHGHHHEQQFYTFAPGQDYVNGNLTPAIRLPYDIFEPGPGFGQDFAAIHVTDKFMDVQATKWNDDFDNTQSTVNFGLFFNKRLVQAPTGGLPQAIEKGDAIAASVASGPTTFLIGAGNITGNYTVRAVSGNGPTSVASTGSFFPVIPTFLVPYSFEGQSFVLVSNGNEIVDYLVTNTGALTKLWQDALDLHGMAVVYGENKEPHLVADEAAAVPGNARFHFFALSPSKMSDEGSILISVPSFSFTQMVTFPTSSGSFDLIRYAATGEAEILTGSVSSDGTPTLWFGSVEHWVADSQHQSPLLSHPGVLIQPVVLPDQTTAILVKSPYCLNFDVSGACDSVNTFDSPFTVRTLTKDGTGTEISWRGALFPPTMTANAVSFVPVAADGANTVGIYTSDGLLLKLDMRD